MIHEKCLIFIFYLTSIFDFVICTGDSHFRWNLIPKPLLKKLCNLDDSLAICAWKRHVPFNGRQAYSKWQICRDHPELNLCKWHNGGMITVSLPLLTTTTTNSRIENSAEAPPTTEESIFVNQPDMIISSKWNNRQIMEETIQKEIQNNQRFDGQLRRQNPSNQELDSDENYDENIMTANQNLFNV